MKIIFSCLIVLLLSLSVFAEDKIATCAKWLMGNEYSAMSKRAESASACAAGASIECASWVLGEEHDSYSNRFLAVKACTPRYNFPDLGTAHSE